MGHGSPLNAIENNRYSRAWEEIGTQLPHPEAILAISAHWYVPGSCVNDLEKPKTVYDMYGFPQELYDLTYPAPGSPALAHDVQQLLSADVEIDNSWGIDHGTWSVLHRMFPEADIPIVQLSVDSTAFPADHLAMGRELSALREQGVMIFGSGDVVHNLGLVDWEMDDGFPWAREFDDAIRNAILERRFDDVRDFGRFGKAAQRSVPTPDHFYPLLYVLGAARDDDEIEVVCDSCTLGAISMTGYIFR